MVLPLSSASQKGEELSENGMKAIGMHTDVTTTSKLLAQVHSVQGMHVRIGSAQGHPHI